MTSSSPRTSDPTRHLLIGLNAAERIHRGALCNLLAAPEQWQHLEAREDLGPQAAALGVTPKLLRRALELKPRATELARRELERAER